MGRLGICPFLHLNKLRTSQRGSHERRHRYLSARTTAHLVGLGAARGDVHKSLDVSLFSRLYENAFRSFILSSVSAPSFICIPYLRSSPAAAIGGPGIIPFSSLLTAAWQILAHHRWGHNLIFCTYLTGSRSASRCLLQNPFVHRGG
jgi:hypothetical protein